jgi:hypothetical protein
MRTGRPRRVLRVQRPCRLTWDGLESGASSRWCGQCGQAVHDLEALAGPEIAALIRANPGGFCGSYLQRGGAPFLVPQEELAERASRVGGLAAAALLASTLSGCSQPAKAPREKTPDHAVVASPSPSPSPKELSHERRAATPPTLTQEQREALRVLGYIAP